MTLRPAKPRSGLIVRVVTVKHLRDGTVISSEREIKEFDGCENRRTEGQANGLHSEGMLKGADQS